MKNFGTSDPMPPPDAPRCAPALAPLSRTSAPLATRRRLVWIAVVVCGALAAMGAALSAFGPGKIVFTEVQLQDRVNRELPREFHGVTVERATVGLADDRISLRVEVRATALGQAFAALVSARGVPQYDANRGALFFNADDIRFDDVTIESGSLAERVDRLGARLGGRFGDQIKQNLSRIETAASAVVAAGVKNYLAARPVYRFKDDFKGMVIKAAVTDVAVLGNTFVIGVSLLALTTTVGAWLFGLLLALLCAVELVRNPCWGLLLVPEILVPDID